MNLSAAVILVVFAACTTRPPVVPTAPVEPPPPPLANPTAPPPPTAEPLVRDAVAAWRRGAFGECAALASRADFQAAAPTTARFLLGLAASGDKRFARAAQLLAAFDDTGAPPVPGLDPQEAELALRITLAQGHAAQGDHKAAQTAWGRVAALPFVQPHEAAFAHIGIDRGATKPTAMVGSSTPRIALVVPLSGPLQILGERLIRGAQVALTVAGLQGGVGTDLLVRDVAAYSDPAALVSSLKTEGTVGIVGLSEPILLQAARDLHTPLVLLDEAKDGARDGIFQILPGAEARAASLGHAALKSGARTFAIAGPDTPATRRLADAFRAAVSTGGGVVVADLRYAPTATSFSPTVTALKKIGFEALFVPDDARKLELIAPALAAADLWPQPFPPPPQEKSARDSRRPILLLSTARGLGSGLLRNARRYVQGALLAPGFFPDPADPASLAFIDAYRALYHEDPGASDAYAFDAVSLLIQILRNGARSANDINAALGDRSAKDMQGATGSLRFAPDHTRAVAAPVYVVKAEAIQRL